MLVQQDPPLAYSSILAAYRYNSRVLMAPVRRLGSRAMPDFRADQCKSLAMSITQRLHWLERQPRGQPQGFSFIYGFAAGLLQLGESAMGLLESATSFNGHQNHFSYEPRVEPRRRPQYIARSFELLLTSTDP